MVICLERGADLHVAQLVPLPLTRVVPEKGPLNGCVCMCVVSCRSRRTLESRQNMDDDKISMLEEELRKAKAIAVEAERNYEEVCFILCPTC